jgi:hypothetical protein
MGNQLRRNGRRLKLWLVITESGSPSGQFSVRFPDNVISIWKVNN